MLVPAVYDILTLFHADMLKIVHNLRKLFQNDCLFLTHFLRLYVMHVYPVCDSFFNLTLFVKIRPGEVPLFSAQEDFEPHILKNHKNNCY